MYLVYEERHNRKRETERERTATAKTSPKIIVIYETVKKKITLHLIVKI